jgi:cathepsin L
LVLLLVLIPAVIYCLSVEESFQSWAKLHGRKYNHENEYNYRLGVYKKNLEFVENHNRLHLGFSVAMNKFGDLTNEEFRALYLMPKFNASQVRRTGELHVAFDIPKDDQVDWRTKGVVTGVKNQGQCGSCWAFSATGSIEGAWGIKKGKLNSISEQQLVDCSGSYGNYGCDGGLMDSAFQYLIAVKGSESESVYPYTAEDGDCAFDVKKVVTTINSYKDVQSGSENALQSAIKMQPVSVAIDASQSSFQFYSGGVYYDQYCSSTQLDHGVLAVGYGTDSSSKKDYYIVKNSWGEDWGVQGYILMSRNKNNLHPKSSLQCSNLFC